MELFSAICEPVAAPPSGLGKDGVRGGSNITLPLYVGFNSPSSKQESVLVGMWDLFVFRCRYSDMIDRYVRCCHNVFFFVQSLRHPQ